MPKGIFYKSKEFITHMSEIKKGDKNPSWKGEKVGYPGVHDWIKEHYGRPNICENCKTTTAKRFEWANISGKYKRDISDFKRLCTKCHRKFDSHLIAKGEKTRWAKLRSNEVIKIRKYYKECKYTKKQLATIFNVQEECVRRVIVRKTWKHI